MSIVHDYKAIGRRLDQLVSKSDPLRSQLRPPTGRGVVSLRGADGALREIGTVEGFTLGEPEPSVEGAPPSNYRMRVEQGVDFGDQDETVVHPGPPRDAYVKYPDGSMRPPLELLPIPPMADDLAAALERKIKAAFGLPVKVMSGPGEKFRERITHLETDAVACTVEYETRTAMAAAVTGESIEMIRQYRKRVGHEPVLIEDRIEVLHTGMGRT